jgi:hypothetical protein
MAYSLMYRTYSRVLEKLTNTLVVKTFLLSVVLFLSYFSTNVNRWLYIYIIILSVVQFYLCVYRFCNCLCKTLFYGKFYKKTNKCVTEGEHCEKAGRDNGDIVRTACTVTNLSYYCHNYCIYVFKCIYVTLF